MSMDRTRQAVLFPDLFRRPLHVAFSETDTSSDGGAVLVKAADARLGLTAALAGALSDRRDPAKVVHAGQQLLAQRIYGLACGYEDANDAARLSDDPLHRLLLERDPQAGPGLASQPTLSRFENAADAPTLLRLGTVLAERVIAAQRRRRRGRARWITVDLDVTDDATHGAQQLSFFHGHYDTWCYLPLLAFLRLDREPEQYLVGALLRPGNAAPTLGVRGLLARLLPCLRQAFPGAHILVRLDGGFAHPALLTWLEEQPRVDYVIGLPGNAVVRRKVRPLLRQAQKLSRRSGWTEHVYGEIRYAAQTWPHARRVLVKAEVVVDPSGRKPPRENPRFVVTSLRRGTPQRLYERLYCARGEIENRLKELQHDLALGRTSCMRFAANQLRVLLSAAAYALLQVVRQAAAGTAHARAQAGTLRLLFLKLAARVVTSVRRIVVHLPATALARESWRALALRLGAQPG